MQCDLFVRCLKNFDFCDVRYPQWKIQAPLAKASVFSSSNCDRIRSNNQISDVKSSTRCSEGKLSVLRGPVEKNSARIREFNRNVLSTLLS